MLIAYTISEIKRSMQVKEILIIGGDMDKFCTETLSPDVQEKTAYEILDYLLKHPNSKDTLEGIAEWWLEMHYIDYGVDLVAMALTHLCSKGIIQEKRGTGQRSSYYELNMINAGVT